MHLQIQQILWHNKEPVLSCDIFGNSRLATAGADQYVRIWTLSAQGEVTFVSTLARHTSVVNCVRWSYDGKRLASAGDDGVVYIWQQSQTASAPASIGILESDDTEFNQETWRISTTLRSGAELYDLAWSPDNSTIIVTSIDNNARLYNTESGKNTHTITKHSHYVQGVAWDPLGEFIVTQSCDRSIIIHKNISPLYSTFARHSAIATEDGKSHKMFHNEYLATYFRRLTWTPDGALLLVPAAIYSIEKNGVLSHVNTVYIFARNTLSSHPIAHLPNLTSAALVIRPNPIKYTLRESSSAPIFSFPYRWIYAVATVDSVIIYDTQQTAPIALLTNIHYANLTDLSWTACGHILVISSSDGFCSTVRWEEGQLGDVFGRTDRAVEIDVNRDNVDICEGGPDDIEKAIRIDDDVMIVEANATKNKIPDLPRGEEEVGGLVGVAATAPPSKPSLKRRIAPTFLRSLN